MAMFPAPPKRGDEVLRIDEFLGVDFTNYPSNVDPRRSPGAVNMVRSVPGKVRKSMGYEKMRQYAGAINGVWWLKGRAEPVMHAGTRLLCGDAVLYAGMADRRSAGFVFGEIGEDGVFRENLYLLDGRQYLVLPHGAAAAQPVQQWSRTHVPLCTIARAPAGGGTQYEALNLLCPKFRERFLADGKALRYQLSFAPLDAGAPVTVRLMNAAANWQTLAEGTHYSVERASGVVVFASAPAAGPGGEDNVEIEAQRTVPGYAARINACGIAARYGVAGAADRLFVSGNAEFAHYDWYSGQNDPTYFADTAYATLGGAGSAIVGYSVVGRRLAAHKDEQDPQRSIVFREGEMLGGKAAFPVCGTAAGPGAVGRHAFAGLDSEPLFLTRLGVYALTPADVTGERYSQCRSFYLNGRLLAQEGLENACCCTFRDMYILGVNGALYILDGLQPAPPEKGMPYSTRQYAAFYRENVPARLLWERDGRLWFGTEEGGVYRFFNEPDDPQSYHDDGAAIRARWELPELSGRTFFKRKTFRGIAVRLASAVATGVRLYGQDRGFWRRLSADDATARYLHFARLTFSRFSFSGDATPKTVRFPARVARVDKARFALENDALNEPFGLFDVAVSYREGRNS